MDPNANLNEILEIAKRIDGGIENARDILRLAELVIAMDEWLRSGGFLPITWAISRKLDK
jgi:hypothetical protein